VHIPGADIDKWTDIHRARPILVGEYIKKKEICGYVYVCLDQIHEFQSTHLGREAAAIAVWKRPPGA